MYTGTTNKDEVGKIVQDAVNSGYTIVTVTKDKLGQWIITAGN